MDRSASRGGPPEHETVSHHILTARDTLVAGGFTPEDAALDAEVLARDILRWDRGRLLVDGQTAATDDFATRYRRAIRRRLDHEPVAMITGHREFWGLEFQVTPATLVPRPETEIVVEEALRILPREAGATVLDIGTGSGCLAIALAFERRGIRVVATDISRAALLVAMSNARRHKVADRVHFVQTDLAAGLSLSADLIVSNPPYVPEDSAAALPADVLRYEPAAALFGGKDGLAVIRRLFASTADHLAPDGRFIVEFGFGQEDAVRDAATRNGWRIERVLHDLQGIARTIVLARGES